MALSIVAYFLVLFLSIFALVSLVAPAKIVEYNNHEAHFVQMKQESSRIARRSLSKRSLRVRRDIPLDQKCVEQENSFLAEVAKDSDNGDGFVSKFQFTNESKFSMALAWLGENAGTILVVVTEEEFIFAKPSTVYLSTDNGKTFPDITSRLGASLIKKDNGLQKNPNAPSSVYLVAHGTSLGTSVLLRTENGGASFETFAIPFDILANLVFHPSPEKKDLILTIDYGEKRILYLSENGGQNWRNIAEDVISFKWGWTSVDSKDPKEAVYITQDTYHKTKQTIFGQTVQSTDNELKKSTDLGKTWTVLQSHVYSFGLQGKFLYASVHKPEDDSQRLMLVSTDGGTSWNEAQLPSITPDRFYSILDMTEGLIFMHVDNPGDNGHGTIYTSDAMGVVFSESLVHHLYPNYNDLTDFYKVLSMRGVYLASQIQGDSSIRTMITFDRGGVWQPVRRPKNSDCKDESKDCYLQIHNQYSISRSVMAAPPLSTESAVGIILVHGHVAEAIQTSPPDVFVSSDGGYNWILSLKGPHHYHIADQGGLLVAVPMDTETPTVVRFSTDEGQCWHSYTYTNESIRFTGLLTEPGNKAMSVAIWGYGEDDREWRVNVIDFEKVITMKCVDANYEQWNPHSENGKGGCLLGLTESFQRLKKDSWCLNGHARDITNTKTQAACPCTKEDYDCDFGYVREPLTETCIEDSSIKSSTIDICERGHEEELITIGYHKVPGDKCQGGFSPAGDKKQNLPEKCNPGDKSIIAKDLGVQLEQGKADTRSRTAVVTMVILIGLLVIIVLTAVLVRKYNLLRRRESSFRYSVLVSRDPEPDYESTLAAHASIYEDSSDEEAQTKPTQAPAGYGSSSISPIHRVANGAVPHQADQPLPLGDSKVKSYHDDSDDDMLE